MNNVQLNRGVADKLRIGRRVARRVNLAVEQVGRRVSVAQRVGCIVFNRAREVFVVVVKRRRVVPTVLHATQQLNVGENLIARVRGNQICSPHETSIVLLVGIVVLVDRARARRLVYEVIVRGDEQLDARARGQAVGEVLLAHFF